MRCVLDQTSRATIGLNAVAEHAFDGLWASVFYAPASPPKSVLVCAANHKEGSTTVACGLALAGMSQSAGGRVLLADFNLRTPMVHKLMRLPGGPGLSDVLLGQCSLDEALQPINSAPLDVLTVGGQADRVVDVLQSQRVGELMEQLAQRYEHAVFDAAPANTYPDAQVLAGTVGSVVLVAESGRTQREAVAAAKRRLESASGKVLGVVLNKRTYPIPKFLYRRV